MARMFPNFLRPDTRSYAEKTLYKELERQLSDEFTVFHSVWWLLKDLNNDARDGEADFVIIHPQLGILILEVKGGTVSYDGTKDQWFSNGVSIKDPFKQARDNKYSLLRLLTNQLGLAWIVIGHAVAFPKVIVKENIPLPLDAPYEIILDRSKLTSLSDSIKEIFDYWRGQNKKQANFNQAQIKKLESILAPTTKIKPIIEEDEKFFLELSEQQFRLLNWLSSHRRVRISGCAGSGKTLLAVEKARHLRNQGFSVLLTCYNRGLASFLSKNLGLRRNMYIYNFHALCKHLFTKAGLQIPEEKTMATDKLLNEIYPNRLMQAADLLNWRVDAIIVDEGQDFRENWWFALKFLLKDPDNGIFYFFYDNNQDIFGNNWQPPLEEIHIPLTENWRNTQKIHNYVNQYYHGENKPRCIGPFGRDVEILHYESDTDLKNKLSELLNLLVNEEDISPKDIVILTTTRKLTLQNKSIGNFKIKAEPIPNSNEILCNTIYYFKGLESPVVILVNTGFFKTGEPNINNIENLMYVGTSRARHHLIMLLPN